MPQKNGTANSKPMMSCELEICFGIIHSSRKINLPERDAHVAWTNFNKHYEPKTKANLIKKKGFHRMHSKNMTEIPDEWIKNLEFLRRSPEIMDY